MVREGDTVDGRREWSNWCMKIKLGECFEVRVVCR